MPMTLSLTHPHSGEHKLIDRLLAIDRSDAVAKVFDSVAHIDSTPMLFQVCVKIREPRKRLPSGALSHCRDRKQEPGTNITINSSHSSILLHRSHVCCTALTSGAPLSRLLPGRNIEVVLRHQRENEQSVRPRCPCVR